jgi:hypothetical protein
VSGYEARCPSCGAPVVFQLGTSLLRVCDHCGAAVARKGADVASYGKVASLIPTPSVLALGVRGDYPGAPPFELVGRLQLDHGRGTWDEWLMAFGSGQWAWLAEAQGHFYYMGQAPLPPVPEFEDLRVGQTVDLGPPGTFVVSEVQTARFVSAQGELPFDMAPGSTLRYADLSGPGEQFATLDYADGHRAEALYVGREVTLEELGVRGLPAEEERRKKAVAQSLSCPHCGGPLELRAPDRTERVGCPWCGSLLDATHDLAVLHALSSVEVPPLVPLGSRGALGGGEWTVIGFMERSVTVEGVRYPWGEYLLYEARHGFRWLVEAKGHWSFVEPISPGDVEPGGLLAKRYHGRRYKHFQGGTARVDHVVGEFYWEVAVGDTAETADYVSPPYMLSTERTPEEVVWSLGTYNTGAEVWKAFHLAGGPPRAEGVGPHQPSPWAARVGPIWSSAVLGLGLLLLLYVGLLVFAGKEVYRQSVQIAPGLPSGAPEAVLFTDPFEVPRSGNLQLKVHSPVMNSWLYLDGALIEEDTGVIDEFDVEVSYYTGKDSDGTWTEGSQTSRAYVGRVPPGRYVVRLAPQWGGSAVPGGYEVAVTSRVPRFYQVVLAALAILSWPVLLGWRAFRFEMQRWAESDHPWVSQGEDD